MIGQTIEARSLLPKGAFFWFFIATVLCVAGISTGNPHCAIGALFPALMGTALRLRCPSEVIFTLEKQGLVFIDSPKRIDYQAIKAVYLDGSPFHKLTKHKSKSRLCIVHDEGELLLPEQMNVSCHELGEFLVAQILPSPAKELHPTLAEYAKKQIAKFGADKVTYFSQRDHSPRPLSSTATVFGKVLVSCGTLWILISILSGMLDWNEDYFAWLGAGILGILVGPLFWMLGRSNQQSVKIDINKHGPACMVISPTGIGLAQADLQGKLRWEEITEIKNSLGKSFRQNKTTGLHVHFAGGVIVIFDVYDQSLEEVMSLIEKNRRQPGI